MREVGIGKKEIAEKAKKNAIRLDGRLTEPQDNGGKPQDGDEKKG